jgi:hypothetical protein
MNAAGIAGGSPAVLDTGLADHKTSAGGQVGATPNAPTFLLLEAE